MRKVLFVIELKKFFNKFNENNYNNKTNLFGISCYDLLSNEEIYKKLKIRAIICST